MTKKKSEVIEVPPDLKTLYEVKAWLASLPVQPSPEVVEALLKKVQ